MNIKGNAINKSCIRKVILMLFLYLSNACYLHIIAYSGGNNFLAMNYEKDTPRGNEELRRSQLAYNAYLLLRSEQTFKTNKEFLQYAHNSFHAEFKSKDSINVSLQDLDSSIHICLDFSKISDSLLRGYVHKISVSYLERGRHLQAVELLSKGIGYFSNKYKSVINDTNYKKENGRLLSLSIVLGASYEEIGLWDRAMQIYTKTLNSAELLNDARSKAYLYNNMANVYFKKANIDKAEVLWNKALVLNKKLDNKHELITNYSNLAYLELAKKENYPQALSNIFAALSYIDKEEQSHSYAFTQSVIAAIYKNQKNYGLAIEHLDIAIQYAVENDYTLILTEFYGTLSDIYSEMNIKDSTGKYLNLALDLTRITENIPSELSILEKLSVFYSQNKDYKKAFESLNIYTSLNNTFSVENQNKRLSDIELIYEAESEIQQNELLKKEISIKKLSISKQRTLIYIIIITVLIGIIFIFIFFRYQNKLSKEKHSNLEKDKQYLMQKQEELNHALEMKNRELTSKILTILKNNEFTIDLIKDLDKLLHEINSDDASKRSHVRQLISKLRIHGNDATYEEFKYYFEQVHQSFYDSIGAKYPNLTYKDLRLCAFLKLGLSTKEIATITFRELRSIESSRNRLRKKMDISQDENLIDFFAQF